MYYIRKNNKFHLYHKSRLLLTIAGVKHINSQTDYTLFLDLEANNNPFTSYFIEINNEIFNSKTHYYYNLSNNILEDFPELLKYNKNTPLKKSKLLTTLNNIFLFLVK